VKECKTMAIMEFYGIRMLVSHEAGSAAFWTLVSSHSIEVGLE